MTATGRAVRWLTVFLDFPAEQFAAGVAFWRAVTGYGLSAPRGDSDEFATLLPPSGDAYLRVQRLGSGPGRCHLDLHLDATVASLDEAAAQAVELGAREVYREPGELVTLDSPGGFTFCLVNWDNEAVVPAWPAAGAQGTCRVHTLCLDIPPAAVSAETGFWAELTGWEPRQVTVPGFTALRGPAGMPIRLLLQRLDSAAPGQRVAGHVDLEFGEQDRAQVVSRHVALGARAGGTFRYWTVLTDPAGRPYCVVGPSSATPSIRRTSG